MIKTICTKMDIAIMQAKTGFGRFVKEEHGDFGISQIAMIVAAVVIIGLIVGFVTDNLGEFLEGLWDTITEWFNITL